MSKKIKFAVMFILVYLLLSVFINGRTSFEESITANPSNWDVVTYWALSVVSLSPVNVVCAALSIIFLLVIKHSNTLTIRINRVRAAYALRGYLASNGRLRAVERVVGRMKGTEGIRAMEDKVFLGRLSTIIEQTPETFRIFRIAYRFNLYFTNRYPLSLFEKVIYRVKDGEYNPQREQDANLLGGILNAISPYTPIRPYPIGQPESTDSDV